MHPYIERSREFDTEQAQKLEIGTSVLCNLALSALPRYDNGNAWVANRIGSCVTVSDSLAVKFHQLSNHRGMHCSL